MDEESSGGQSGQGSSAVGALCVADVRPETSQDGRSYTKINPQHYRSHPSGIECIDVIEHLSFNSGTAIKYLWRAGLKPGEETLDDLKKALWYVNREILRVSKELVSKKEES